MLEAKVAAFMKLIRPVVSTAEQLAELREQAYSSHVPDIFPYAVTAVTNTLRSERENEPVDINAVASEIFQNKFMNPRDAAMVIAYAYAQGCRKLHFPYLTHEIISNAANVEHIKSNVLTEHRSKPNTPEEYTNIRNQMIKAAVLKHQKQRLQEDLQMSEKDIHVHESVFGEYVRLSQVVIDTLDAQELEGKVSFAAKIAAILGKSDTSERLRMATQFVENHFSNPENLIRLQIQASQARSKHQTTFRLVP